MNPQQDYTEYHHLQHPTMGTLPMFSTGLNLTVMSQGHHPGHQLLYPIDVHQQQQQQQQQLQHQAHHQQQQHHPQHIAVVAHQQQHQLHQPQLHHNQQGHSNQHQQQLHHQQQQQQQQHQLQLQQQHQQQQQQQQQNSNKKQKKGPKVNKDGVPAPKRATTAYINFTQWYREQLKKANTPIPKIGEFGKECAGKWNAMSEEDKAPFLETAARDRDRYKREMAIFKPARDESKPKRPQTAFMIFMADFRKEMAGKEPEGGVSALAKAGGERWRSMTEDDKKRYVEMQATEKARYEQNMDEYRRNAAAVGTD